MTASTGAHRNWKGYRLRGSRRRDRDPAKIDAILRAVFSNSKLQDRLSRYSFVTHWHEIVGSRIAQHARPLKVVRGELYVQVENPIWAQELCFFKDTLLSRLQGFVPNDLTIREIRFVIAEQL